MTARAHLRVLVLLASNDRRGAEIEGERLARELAAQGCEGRCLSLAAGTNAAKLDVEALGTGPLAASTLRALRGEAKRADVVVAYGSTTLPACAIALTASGTPFVYRSIGDPSAWLRSATHRVRTAVLMRRAAAVVALWTDAAADIRRLYRLPSARVHHIPNGRDPMEFAPAAGAERTNARARFGIAPDARLVAVIGALSEEKRVDLAIRAAAELPDHHLLVVGDGPQRAALEALAAVLLADRCTFTGALDDVRPALHAADTLLLTSRTEGQPGAVLEAAMCGLPVVATEVGALPWMRDEGLPISLVPAEAAPSTIATALGELTPVAGPQVPEEFRLDHVVGEWVELLHRVAGAE